MSEVALKEEHLAAMQAAIDEEFERSARLRKVVPTEIPVTGTPYGIVVPEVTNDDKAFRFKTEDLRKPVTLTAEIRIEPHQLGDLDNILTLVRAAVKRMSNAEDRIIAYGGGVKAEVRKGMNVSGLEEDTPGLMFLHEDNSIFSKEEVQKPANLDKLLYDRLKAARRQLEAPRSSGVGPYFEPYAAVLGTEAWALFTAASYEEQKRIATLFESKMIAPISGDTTPRRYKDKDGASEELTAFAVILTREPMTCDLVRFMMPTGSARGYAEDGSLRYVIEGKFLLRVKDKDAFARIWVKSLHDVSNYYITQAPEPK